MTLTIVILTILLIIYVLAVLFDSGSCLLDMIFVIVMLVNINNYKDEMEAKQNRLERRLEAAESVNVLYKDLLSDNNLILVEGK